MLATGSRASIRSAVTLQPAPSLRFSPYLYLHNGSSESLPPKILPFSAPAWGRSSSRIDPQVRVPATQVGARTASVRTNSRFKNRATKILFSIQVCQLGEPQQWRYGGLRYFHSTNSDHLLLSSRTRRGQFVTTEDAHNFLGSLNIHQRKCLEKAMREGEGEVEGSHEEEERTVIERHPPTWHQLRLCKSGV